ncbi:calcium-binding protein [Rhizomonospora bruguierae]|uniref:calcium-binding protein n=1 Tax=Rhizomonospora bruguierae TaxID=1581705 RepID=UPI0020BEE34D|nr:calcium-binding protein [Micromonospora sp. NBRC 107566]
MIEEATVDAYNKDEQLTSLYTTIEDNLAAPFTTTVLGVQVTVRKVDLTAGGIVAISSRGRDRQRIDLLDLPLPHPATRPRRMGRGLLALGRTVTR